MSPVSRSSLLPRTILAIFLLVPIAINIILRLRLHLHLHRRYFVFGSSLIDLIASSDLISSDSTMADKDEAARGNDWEVVSLTASAYAASPGPKLVHSNDYDYNESESPHPLYMSRHFVFSPQLDHCNIPTEPTHDLTEGNPSNKTDSGFSVERKKQDGDLTLKGFDLSDEFAGLEFFQDKGKREEQVYKTAVCSLQDERAMGGSHVYEQKEPTIPELTEPDTPCLVPDVSPDLIPTKDGEHQVSKFPPCKAWWKRSVASLISQAKETNTVWSIFIAAAVMGIVILRQQERWQHKWESSIGNEKAGRLMGPISRLRQAFVGGQRRDSLIRVVGSQNDG